MGHVGATLMVAAIQASHLYNDRVDASIREAPDVGVSYGMLATFGLLVARVSARRRPYYVAGGFLLVVALGWHADFTALGHVTAPPLPTRSRFRASQARSRGARSWEAGRRRPFGATWPDLHASLFDQGQNVPEIVVQ